MCTYWWLLLNEKCFKCFEVYEFKSLYVDRNSKVEWELKQYRDKCSRQDMFQFQGFLPGHWVHPTKCQEGLFDKLDKLEEKYVHIENYFNFF